MIRRIILTVAAMACGAALTLIIHGGSISEIAGAACVSLALVLAATVLPDFRSKAVNEFKRERNRFTIRLL